MQHLSMDGRLALINGVLDGIPTYTMSLIPMPCKVRDLLEGLRRTFLWKGNSEGHTIHLRYGQRSYCQRNKEG